MCVYKGVFLSAPGSGGGFLDTGVPGVSRAQCLDYALIGLSGLVYTYPNLKWVLEEAARRSGHPELATAPIIPYGWSAGALNTSLAAAMISRRMVFYFGGAGDFQSQPYETAFVPVSGFQMNGELDNNTFTSLQTLLIGLASTPNDGLFGGRDSYRARVPPEDNPLLAPAGAMALWYETHPNPVWGTHQGAEFAYYAASEVLKARRALAGGDVVSTNGFVEYPPLVVSNGWLGQIQDFLTGTITQQITTNGRGIIVTNTIISHGSAPYGRKIKRVQIASYGTYTDNVDRASWMVNEKVAHIYRAMMSFYGAYARYNGTAGNSPACIIDLPKEHFLQQGDPVSFMVDLRRFGAGAGISNVTCYLNLEEQGVLTAPNIAGQFYRFAFPAPEKGVHAILIRATDNTGDISECFRTLFIHAPANEAPGKAAGLWPANGEIITQPQTFISWVGGKAATSHNVYFGTNAAALVLLAGAATTTVVEFAAPLAPGTYFWRVDAVNASGTTAGDVQRFEIIEGVFDGFESGDFKGGTGWNGGWTSNTSGVIIDGNNAASGGYSLYMTKWTSAIYAERAFTLAQPYMPARVRFNYKATQWSSTTNLQHKARCRLYDGTWRTLHEMPLVYYVNAPWLAADVDLQAFNLNAAATSFIIRFEIPEPQGQFSVDNVIVTTVVPEPAALLALALAALSLWQRRNQFAY